MKTDSGRIFSLWRVTSLLARKTAFLHQPRGKQNYQALFVYRSDLGENLCHFLSYFTYNHNYNKILKSDWLSSLGNWTVRAITGALKWLFFVCVCVLIG